MLIHLAHWVWLRLLYLLGHIQLVLVYCSSLKVYLLVDHWRETGRWYELLLELLLLGLKLRLILKLVLVPDALRIGAIILVLLLLGHIVVLLTS